MSTPTNFLASTWNNGLFISGADGLKHELPNRAVRGLSDDLAGGAIASVDGHSLYQRDTQGDWSLLARSGFKIAVTLAVDGQVFVGTDDARVLVLDQNQELKQIDCFDSIEGRDSWFAGTAIIDGKTVGPPLGVRSIDGAPNGLLFANVHVGGIPRSVDGGATWTPTIEVNLDAHEVVVDHTNPDLIVAATAEGLCMSHDGGDTWSVHTDGLHERYCSAVTITDNSVFVAASEHHFSAQGAIYRRSTNPGAETLQKVYVGSEDWLDGIADTSCMASKDDTLVIVSAGGSVYVSNDAGRAWQQREDVIAGVSSVLICD